MKKLALIVGIALSASVSAVSNADNTKHLEHIKSAGMDHWKSRGLQFVTVYYLKEEATESGGRVCYQIEHPIEDTPYLGCIEMKEGKLVSDVTIIERPNNDE